LFLADVRILGGSYGEVACVGPMIGAPQAAMVLEKMIALGVRRVVTLGWCGSLQPGVRIGDVVLPTGAFSEEGTSLHYLEDPGKAAPSTRILGVLREKSRETGLVFHEGKVWTTDAPYRETASKVRLYGEAGALAVEMETSALFSVAHFRGIELATVLVVSDELFGGKWTHGFREARFHRAREKLVEWVLEAVAGLWEAFPEGRDPDHRQTDGPVEGPARQAASGSEPTTS